MSNTVATRTRGARRREQKHSLPIHPVVAVHVARVSALYHGETFEQTARVCVAWQKGSSQARHLKKCSSYGELKSGKRYARFDRPHAAAFLPDGNLVIADCDNFRLQTWSRAADSYMIQERDLGATACPTGVISEGSFLYIVEHGSHRVVKTRASSGSLVAAAGQWGGADGELRHPWGLASSGKAIYVVDGGNARICCFALSNLAFRFAFGDGGFGPEGQYRLVDPKGIAHHAGRLYVADAGAHCVWVFDEHGCLERVIGKPDSSTPDSFAKSDAPGAFATPMGIAIGNGRLYVTEAQGERLQVLGIGGEPLQIVRFGAPASGVCVDARNVCVTLFEPEMGGLDLQTPKKLPPAVHIFDVCQQFNLFETTL